MHTIDKEKAMRDAIEDLKKVDLFPGRRFVPGAGSLDADLMFIGEAPGKKEDETGLPFVGAAGKFLDEMLASIGLKRDDIYISNMVKQRPPDNRDPSPEEIAAHWPIVQRQVAIINPKIVILLGRHAMYQFLPNVGTISQIHGKPFRRKDGRVYLPLYHPAAALYNGGMRQTLIEDFQKIPAIIKKVTEKQKEEA